MESNGYGIETNGVVYVTALFAQFKSVFGSSPLPICHFFLKLLSAVVMSNHCQGRILDELIFVPCGELAS